MARKEITDEQLETMGRTLATMHQEAIEVWRLAMRTMPIASSQYRMVCASGRAVQRAYVALEEEAWNRGWPDNRVNEVFFSRVSCGFS